MEAFAQPTPLLSSRTLYDFPTSLHQSCRPLRAALPRRRRRQPPICEARNSAPPRPGPLPSARGFVLWGPPGSGKSTLCELLSHSHGLVHISTGALLRAHVLYETEWGVKARPFVRATAPVPDEIVIPMVLERLRQVDCAERGFLLDGFPRNVHQHAALREAGFGYCLAFMLHAPRETLSRRIRYRRLDPETDSLYNLKLRPADSQEVLERLVVLDKDLGANVAELFANHGKITAEMFDMLAPHAVRVDADRSLAEILRDIAAELELQGVKRLSEVGERPLTRVTPTVATPPNVLGRPGSRVDQDINGADNINRPASAAAAMRAKTGLGQLDLKEAKGAQNTKSPITLIRCDGYMCERESVEGSHIAFRGAATEQVMLVWNREPKTVLLLVKKGPALMGNVLEAARYLLEVKRMNVIVEAQVQTQAIANGLFLDTFSSATTLHENVDFVVCLGGDGLILHVSTLFKQAVPPVISFNLGSLGFLTPFHYDYFGAEIEDVMRGNCNLSLRMRLTCRIVSGGEVRKEFEVLNEVVVDRGASPYLCNLDCFCDGKFITTVQADGIIMSTPTGSTAYSMSAGGSMVHPSVPAILFTPICPHSLSFRPIVFPDSAKIRIHISEDARSHAWASFDGKSRQQLKRGDSMIIEMNLYPVPTVNKTDHTGDWFQSLDRAFNFNSRAMQKRLETQPPPKRLPLRPPAVENGVHSEESQLDENAEQEIKST